MASTRQTSAARRVASLADTPIDLSALFSELSRGLSSTAADTVLYLAYGSNLSAETFLGRRGIRPVSQVNVVVPALRLTFSLAGIPYQEPCFGNTEYRTTDNHRHNDAWTKGLVGVVYEVTRAEYAHIIATEGGGAEYRDIVVDCYVLGGSSTVLKTGQGGAFKAHTLYAPAARRLRPPGYAQPSARYLKLIVDGAAEHGLPCEYQAYLRQIRAFRITTLKQRVGQACFLVLWAPAFLLVVFVLGRIFARPDGSGRYPAWLARLLSALTSACWASYDVVFKPIFGDGERTIGDDDDDDDDDDDENVDVEKLPLIAPDNE